MILIERMTQRRIDKNYVTQRKSIRTTIAAELKINSRKVAELQSSKKGYMRALNYASQVLKWQKGERCMCVR